MTPNSIKVNPNLIVDRRFFEFLVNTDNIICSIILNTDTQPGVNYISPVNGDMISYLPDSKVKESFDPFKQNGRITIKIGRLVSKLVNDTDILKYKISQPAIEEFVNYYKSWFDESLIEYKIIEGEEIRKWYLDRNYFTPNGSCVGTLWNSCMRYIDRQKFLDLYCANKNIKMLIMTTMDLGVEKVRARAILWENVEVISSSIEMSPNIKIMDRIYSVFDSDIFIFKRWASQNGYIPKWEQNAKSHQFFDVKGEAIKIKCNIKIDKKDFDYYPYLDTFPFFNIMKGTLSNDEYSSNWMFKLVQANGNLEPVIEEEDEEFYDED